MRRFTQQCCSRDGLPGRGIATYAPADESHRGLEVTILAAQGKLRHRALLRPVNECSLNSREKLGYLLNGHHALRIHCGEAIVEGSMSVSDQKRALLGECHAVNSSKKLIIEGMETGSEYHLTTRNVLFRTDSNTNKIRSHSNKNRQKVRE